MGAEKDDDVFLQGGDGYVYLAAKFAANRVLKNLDDFKVSNVPQGQTANFSPDMLDKLPPGIREQFLQQQRQKIMQNQMMKQMIEKAEKENAKKSE
ncbi:MAG: hypothetical protein M5R36_01135 [Deltaproteobacteria bacterium]|nr:hypothetical protein [Deltaproteobacteria bacterium]